MPSPGPLDVVVLHGVGAPVPGSVLAASLVGLAGAPQTFVREDITIAGVPYPRAVAVEPGAIASVTEVNWSDLLRPIRGPIGTVRHLALLAFALLDSAEHVLLPYRLVAGLRVVFQSVFLWCVWPAITCLLVVVYHSTPAIAAGLGITVTLAMAVLSWYLRRYGKAMLAGCVWAAISAGLAIAAWSNQEAAVRISAELYAGGQVFGIICLAVASLCASHAYSGHKKVSVWLGHLAILYVPVILASALGAILWAGVLWAVRKPDQEFGKWGEWFSAGLRYDLQRVEYITAGATAAIAVIALLASVAYGFSRCREAHGRSSTRSGQRAQASMFLLLCVAPALLTGVAGYFLYSYAWGTGEKVGGAEVLAVYRLSALRILPYVFAALGPLNVIMDVLGDVAFYLAQREELRIAPQAIARLERLVMALPGPVVIVAHSQGSIIALRALSGSAEADMLVTVGSPAESLYCRFLGHPDSLWTPKVSTWLNFFRAGDYIGGPIPGADPNQPLGLGGHTGYFAIPELWKRVFARWASTPG